MTVNPIGLSNTYQTQATDQKNEIETDAFKKKLQEAAENQDEDKLKEVCQQFESIFVNMLFKEMRKTIQEGGLVEKSQARETFEGMLDEEMSKQVSEAGGVGLADMMVKSFMNRYDKSSEEAPTETLDLKG